ncbi:conjugative transfer signal peptidase TraF [Pseudomonas helleri]|uniref:conjugative transfer signal peptidase TraF n=1 Tax=Pseudomonas helleri TaxID=1608996 RepID=UPI003FD09AED
MSRVVAVTVLALSISAGAIVAGTYAAGGRINTSKSLEVGLYWVIDEPITKGSYVMFCPPQQPVFLVAKERGYIGAGFCPGNYGHLMKKVLAAKGDTISVTSKGVTVNGAILPYSIPIDADGMGRPLPQFAEVGYTLKAPELLLMSDRSPTSFDGRYFGLITRSQITSVVRPIFTLRGE